MTWQRKIFFFKQKTNDADDKNIPLFHDGRWKRMRDTERERRKRIREKIRSKAR